MKKLVPLFGVALVMSAPTLAQDYPTKPINRGKLLTAAKLKELGEWGRYRDVDGDGIAYRTIPGDGLPAYFTRGSGHNAKGQYSERPDDYVTVILPEFVPARWWQHLLHNQRALLIKGALLFRPNTVVTSVPFHLAK